MRANADLNKKLPEFEQFTQPLHENKECFPNNKMASTPRRDVRCHEQDVWIFNFPSHEAISKSAHKKGATAPSGWGLEVTCYKQTSDRSKRASNLLQIRFRPVSTRPLYYPRI